MCYYPSVGRPTASARPDRFGEINEEPEESEEDVLYVSRQAPTMKKIETPVIGNWKNAAASAATMSASTMNESETSFAPIDYEEMARQRFEHKKVSIVL